MKVITTAELEPNSPEWLAFREDKIMGTTTVTAFTGKKLLKDFWCILAAKLVMSPDDIETAMSRGHRLEDEAVQKAVEKLGLELYRPNGEKVVCFMSDEHDNLGYSPDDVVAPNKDGMIYADIEVKCFEGPAHLESVIQGFVPDKTQMLRPFTINPDLKTRYYVFYHDRIAVPELSLHIMEIKREDYEVEIEILGKRDEEALAKIDEIMERYF